MTGKVIDAYRFPQSVRPGCQHQLGCKCATPYYLRASTPSEEAHEAKIRAALGGARSSSKPSTGQSND